MSKINLIAVNGYCGWLVLNGAIVLETGWDQIKMSENRDTMSQRRRRLREIEWSIASTLLALSSVGVFLAGLILIFLTWVFGMKMFWIGALLTVAGCGFMWAWKHFFWDRYLHQIEDLS